MSTECYCTQFRRSANALTRIHDDELRPVGLKISQVSLLRALHRLVEASLTEVANEVAVLLGIYSMSNCAELYTVAACATHAALDFDSLDGVKNISPTMR